MERLDLILKSTIELDVKQLTGFVMLRKVYFNDYKDTDVKYYNILDFNQ